MKKSTLTVLTACAFTAMLVLVVPVIVQAPQTAAPDTMDYFSSRLNHLLPEAPAPSGTSRLMAPAAPPTSEPPSTPRTDAAQSPQPEAAATESVTPVEPVPSAPAPVEEPVPPVVSAPTPAKPAPAPTPAVTAGKIAYLTFDDGPSANTDAILNILKEQRIKATFFVNGRTDDEGIRLYKRIHKEGHTLGNHTFSHKYNKVYASVPAFTRDVRKLDELLQRTVGESPRILRFPGGSNNTVSLRSGGSGIMNKIAKEMLEEGYAYFDWNVSSTDAARAVQPTSDIVSATIASARHKKRAIILMHDADPKTTTVKALPEVIRGLQAMGFKFDVLRPDSYTFRFLNP
ncbi:MAG: pdaA 1 [Paenibacillaceae bacterium]|jgi:peptidoglycan/xylan/chitin deacetylase (PgdA/CDA1 family)|nr:pdaA 1 [Paenibacillaceae bacterium]